MEPGPWRVSIGLQGLWDSQPHSTGELMYKDSEEYS